MVIGITGNSGSGKSEVSKILAQKLHAEIVDADEIVRKISEPGNEYYEKQVELFGEENNKLNKSKIAEIIYNNTEKRERLNDLTFKYVVIEIKNQAESINGENVILDVPLLFESGLDKMCDFTIGIIAKKEMKIDRISKRDNIDRKTAEARLNIQKSEEYYIKNADYIIENNGQLNEINLEEICTKIGKN